MPVDLADNLTKDELQLQLLDELDAIDELEEELDETKKGYSDKLKTKRELVKAIRKRLADERAGLLRLPLDRIANKN